MNQSHLKSVLATAAILVGTASTELSAAGLPDLTRPIDGRTRRVSSHDPNWENGNRDWREIAPGETLTLAELKGPGTIRHMWFTINAQDEHYPRSLVLRMYWDGQQQAAVEAPFGDFFAVGHGLRREVDSEPVSVVSEGRAYACFWAMPFRQSARITVTNDADRPVPKFYYYIDYDEQPTLPEDTLYFHAQYRQEYPAAAGDYLVCDVQGRGHYVGTVLSVQLRTDGWFGEGDDRFYIDGEDKPSLHGTGTEDYLNDAWGLREIMRPYYGAVYAEGFQFGDRTSAYRWHIHDPIRFTKSLRVTIEDKGQLLNKEGNTVSGHREREDLFSSVAFWYQSGHSQPFGAVPPLDQRLLETTRVEMESFAKMASVSTGHAEITVNRSPIFSGGTQLLVSGAQKGVTVSVPFTLRKPLTGAGRLVLNTCISAGIWKAHLDGRIIERMRHTDLYNGYYRPTDFNLGYVELAAGRHELTFECLGKRAEARDSQLGIDVIKVEHVKPHYAR